MEPLQERLLKQFLEMQKEAFDLHVLFEVAGNDPAERQRVLDVIDELVREGLMESQENDIHALTPKGKRAASA